MERNKWKSVYPNFLYTFNLQKYLQRYLFCEISERRIFRFMNHQISFIVEQSVKVLKVATLSYNFLVSNDAFIISFFFFIYKLLSIRFRKTENKPFSSKKVKFSDETFSPLFIIFFKKKKKNWKQVFHKTSNENRMKKKNFDREFW